MAKMLEPLNWLIGKWYSIEGNGIYPTIQSFKYSEQLIFEFNGQPLLHYSAKSRNTVTDSPMHSESGFLRIKPGSCDIALMTSHNFGVNIHEEGSVVGNKIQLASKNISRMSFAKDPAVTKVERTLTLHDDGILEHVFYMETATTPLTEHLRCTYRKQS